MIFLYTKNGILITSSVFWSTTSFVHLAILYGIFSILIRIELGISGNFLFDEGNQNSFYRSVTSHGLGMVFLFIMPGIISSLGNFTVPHSFCGIDFATPRLNNLAFWLSVMAIQILIIGISYRDGISGGWTLYFPLTGIDFSSSISISIAIIFLHVLGLSSEFGAITFIVSIQLAKSTGINIIKFCLISWSIIIVSFLLITTLPVLGAGITLVFSERHSNVSTLLGSFVDSADPVAFQHLFWFFGHPEVYVIILPAFGIISEKIREISANKVVSHPGMALALWTIGLVGYFVWAHHMFTVGMSDISRVYFSSATAVIGIPTAIKIFSWSLGISEIKLRNIEFIVIIGFIICFLFGGITGLLLANSTVDLAYHDTYFVVGHFHFVLSIAAAISALLYFIIFLNSISEMWGNYLLMNIIILSGLISVNILFGIQHSIGIEGHPRRVFLTPELFIVSQNLSNLSILPILFSLAAISVVIERTVLTLNLIKLKVIN